MEEVTGAFEKILLVGLGLFVLTAGYVMLIIGGVF